MTLPPVVLLAVSFAATHPGLLMTVYTVVCGWLSGPPARLFVLLIKPFPATQIYLVVMSTLGFVVW